MAAKKLRADERGNETEVPLDDWIDIGVLGEDGDAALRSRSSGSRSSEEEFTAT